MDEFVEQGVGEGGVIELIVAPATEAVVVYEHVLPEATLVLEGYVCRPCN